MQYIVWLRRRPSGSYLAIAPAVPDCTGEGETREEALSRLKSALQDWLAETEVATIDIRVPAPGNSGAMTLGTLVPLLLIVLSGDHLPLLALAAMLALAGLLAFEHASVSAAQMAPDSWVVSANTLRRSCSRTFTVAPSCL